jgi:hypothetical protein
MYAMDNHSYLAPIIHVRGDMNDRLENLNVQRLDWSLTDSDFHNQFAFLPKHNVLLLPGDDRVIYAGLLKSLVSSDSMLVCKSEGCPEEKGYNNKVILLGDIPSSYREQSAMMKRIITVTPEKCVELIQHHLSLNEN